MMAHRSADEVLYGPPEDDGWKSDDEATTNGDEDDSAKLVKTRQAEDRPTRNAPEFTGPNLRHSATIDAGGNHSHRSPRESRPPSRGTSEGPGEREWRDWIRQKAKMAIDSIIIAHGMRELQGAPDLWAEVVHPLSERDQKTQRDTVSEGLRSRRPPTMSEARMGTYMRQARDCLIWVSILQRTGGIETSVRDVSGHDLYRHACGVVDGVLSDRILDRQFKADLLETLECGTLIARSAWETFHQWCARTGKPEFLVEIDDEAMSKARDEAWCCWWNGKEDMAFEPLDKADRELMKFRNEVSAPHVRTNAQEQHLTNLESWVHGYEAAYRLQMDHDPVVLPQPGSDELQEEGQSDREEDQEADSSQVSSQTQELNEAPADTETKSVHNDTPTGECKKSLHVEGRTTLDSGGPSAENRTARCASASDGRHVWPGATMETTRGSSAQNTSQLVTEVRSRALRAGQTDEPDVQRRSRLPQALGRFMTWLDC